MRYSLLTLVCCALATALPTEEDGGEKWGGGKGHHGGVNVNKSVDGGVGGGVKVGDIGVVGGGGGGGGCDAVACDIKCRKLGDESGYCDTTDATSGLLGLDILGTSMPGCICVPKTTTDCTSTTTATSTYTVTTSTCSATATTTATDTYTSTVTSSTTATDTQTTTATATVTDTQTYTATATTTTTATACPSVACFCCGPQTQLGYKLLTGTCDIIPNTGTCPINPQTGRKNKICCDGSGKCTQS